MTCQGMSRLTEARKRAIWRSSSSLSLKPGMTSVTTSSQMPRSWTMRMVLVMLSSVPPRLAVVAVVEALEIDLVGDDPGAEEVEHLRRGVAVGDEGAGQPGRFRLAEDGDGPLGGDERLVVAGDDQPGAFAPGQRRPAGRRHGPNRGDGVRIAQSL